MRIKIKTRCIRLHCKQTGAEGVGPVPRLRRHRRFVGNVGPAGERMLPLGSVLDLSESVRRVDEAGLYKRIVLGGKTRCLHRGLPASRRRSGTPRLFRGCRGIAEAKWERPTAGRLHRSSYSQVEHGDELNKNEESATGA